MSFFNYLAIIMMVSCTTQIQEEDVISSVSFESSTRGGYKSITMYERKVVINKNHRAESYILEKGDWTNFLNTLSEIDPKDLKEFESDGISRSRDAAWHSNIVIYIQDSLSYHSQTFDNDNAPKELDTLMTLFIAINKKYSQENSLF